MKKYIISPLIRQYAVVAIVNLAVFTTGMSVAWPSPVLVKLRNPEESPLSRPITEEEGSWIVSIGFLCSACSNMLLGSLMDVIGRKNCILLAYVPKLTVGILYIFATEVWMIILGRAVIITTDLFVFTVVPTYASEIASKEYRGALGTVLQFFAACGELVTLSVGPFMSYRNFNILFTSIIAITLIPIIFLPESPTYVYSKGREEEALKTLTFLRENNVSANQEVEEYRISAASKDKVDKKSLFKNKAFMKALILGVTISVGAQLVGFSAVTFNLQTILISTNTSVRPEIASVIIGVIQVVISFAVHAIFSSRFGRKTILITTLCGLCLGMLGLGSFFKISEPEDYQIVGFMNYLPLISLILVICCYIAGIGSLIWVIIGEIFSDSSRAFGVSICVTWISLLTFLLTKFFPAMNAALGPASTYWFFSSMTAILICIIVVFFPETKGKTFREIQMILVGEKGLAVKGEQTGSKVDDQSQIT